MRALGFVLACMSGGNIREKWSHGDNSKELFNRQKSARKIAFQFKSF